MVRVAIALLFIGVSVLGSPESWATAPPWAKNGTQTRIGNRYTVVCFGSGIAVDLARKEAVRSCNNSAIQQLKRQVKVKSLSVETEKDVAFHQEVEEQGVYKNLRCEPKDESIEESDSSFLVWLKCEYDLKAVIVTHGDAPDEKGSDTKRSSNPNDLMQVKSKGGSGAPKTQSITTSGEKRILRLVSVPQCEDVLISGNRPRKIECDSNPLVVMLYSDDTEILVRAKGYLPKHLPIAKNETLDSTVYIMLEEMTR